MRIDAVAEALAERMRARGFDVVVAEGRLRVSAPGLRARELGGPGRAPEAVVGPAVRDVFGERG